MTLLSHIQDPADKAAWRLFVDLYTPLIFRYCRKRGLQDADARDIVQDVFVRVSRAIGNFEYDPAKGRFRNWLGLITHQQILRFHSKDKGIGRGIGGGVGNEICDSLSGQVDAAWIDAFNAYIYRCARENIRSEFDESTWTAFELVWEAGASPRQVAQQLNCPTQLVYQAKFQVFQRLKAEIWRLSADVALLNPRRIDRHLKLA